MTGHDERNTQAKLLCTPAISAVKSELDHRVTINGQYSRIKSTCTASILIYFSFSIIMQERNVRGAADRLCLDDTEVGRALTRLHRPYGDPLFDRIAEGRV